MIINFLMCKWEQNELALEQEPTSLLLLRRKVALIKLINLDLKKKRGVEMKTIKITADNKISIVDVDFSNNRAIMDAMGGPVEVVTTNELYDFFKCPVLMMLDKNGYKPKDVNGFCPSANAVASFLYGYVKTGIPILGDVILAQPAGGRIENLEGVGELEEKMQISFIAMTR